jgi:hypothetical protein
MRGDPQGADALTSLGGARDMKFLRKTVVVATLTWLPRL